MSMFQNVYFVNEFAYRTKLNYYYQKKRFAKNEEDRKDADAKIKNILQAMNRNGFAVEEYYEVTDLINSLVGLLVFPEQATYNLISSREVDMRYTFPHLWKCMQSADYVNTYENERGDKNSPQNIIRHLRNSLAHNRVMIVPIAATIGHKRQITAITFKDESISYNNSRRKKITITSVKDLEKVLIRKTNEKRQEFALTISVNDLEYVVMEICDYLIHLRG